MIQVGSNIACKDDPLKKVDLDYLYHSLINPKPDISMRIRQLRLIRNLDAKQYSLQKRQLPYLVCGVFNPPYRKGENFAYTEYFILDVDNISEKGYEITSLRSVLQSDTRVVMCFVSPGEDGLKLIFRLKDKCYDAGIYSIFYKAFAHQFSVQYNIGQVVDTRTCDVSRACFISIDSEAYYNPNADTVDLTAFVNEDNPFSVAQLKHDTKSTDVNDTVANEDSAVQTPDPDDETMRKIKELLNPKLAKKQHAKPVFVPEVLEDIINDLKTYIENTGVIVEAISSIQYGKKISMRVGLKRAEINLFYGKRGFSVVKSPRCGTSSELNDLLADVITLYVQEL